MKEVEKKLNLIPRKYQKLVNIKLFTEMLRFLDDGGGFEEYDSNAKMFGCITSSNLTDWLYMQHSDNNIDVKSLTIACKNFIAGIGQIPSIPLYRGMSNEEYDSICNTGKTLLKYPISFSSLKSHAAKFGHKVIEVVSKTAKFVNMNEFNANWYLASAAYSATTSDEVIEELESIDFEYMFVTVQEFEWICMPTIEFVATNESCKTFYAFDQNTAKDQTMKTEKTTKKVDEAAFKSFNDLDLSKIPGSVTQILTANFDRFNACRTYEDVVALCHELFDNAGLDTDWTRKFFFRLDQIKADNPNPRRAYEKAMLFMNNARMKGMGLGMGRGSRRFGESEVGKEFVVTYTDIDGVNEITKSKSFSRKEDALAYAKKTYLNPNTAWYQDAEKTGIVEDYGVSTAEELANLDYDDLIKTGKVEFDDGMHLVAKLTLTENNTVKESKSIKNKYTKKQIMEAIKHWKGVLKQMNENINSDVTVADLISMLEDVANKSLPIKCVCLMPEDFEGTSYSGPLDQNHLVVDDDGDEVMLTMDFT